MTKRILLTATATATAVALSLSATARASTAGLDPTFHGTGLFRLDHGLDNVNAETAVAVQPDGKLVVVDEELTAGVSRIHRLDADGSPDATFGSGGEVELDHAEADRLFSVLVQPDGRILVGGALGGRAALYRFTGSGAPDESFGTHGFVALPSLGTGEVVSDVAEAGGTIVAVGETFAGTTSKVAVWKRHAVDGTDFGARTLSSGDGDGGSAVAIQPDGHILVGGFTNHDNDGFVSRLDANLVFDLSFHGTGTVFLDRGGAETVASIALQPDGRIVAAGRAGADLMVSRLTTDGEPDPAFNSGAPRILDGGGFDQAARVLVQPDGKLVIAGSTDLDEDMAFFRLTAAGAPDPTFDGDGVKRLDAGGLDAVSDAALQPDGDIVAVGLSSDDGVVARLLGDPLTLNVGATGPGHGRITSSPPGIDCPGTCGAKFDVGTRVTLSETPAPGSSFLFWGGCDPMTAPVCALTLHGDTAVSAAFATAGTGGGGMGGGHDHGDHTPPAISHVRVRVVRHRATVRFALSERAVVTVAIRRGSRTVLTVRRRAIAGFGSLRVGLPRRGRLTLVLTATDRAGNTSDAVTLRVRR
jgi:uncharacterized delta-60 repeat protein